MDSFNDSSLSAYFPGLVDVCINDDGQLTYVILKNGELVCSPEQITETEIFSIPEKKHFPFAIPRATEVMRYFNQEDHTLYDDVLSYLKRFSALDDKQWAIVAHYVFLTYLHDHSAIDYCPYLLFNAVPERGKSRTGKSVSYIAFRGIHLIELREANIFRYSQNLHGTLFFDLMDLSKKAERSNCDDILLLRFEKGAKCSRILYPDQGAFNDTEYFEIYGPTIIASNKQVNDILETRCLPITMPNRPGNYENPRPEHAQELKERLVAWRAKNMLGELDDMQPIEGISGRLWDISKPLFLINSRLQVDFHILEESILDIAGEKDESRKGTVEGRLFVVIREIINKEGLDRFAEWSVKVSDIRAGYNQDKPEDRHVSSQWIGKRLKNMSFRNRIVRGYSEINMDQHEYETLLKQYGYVERDLSKPTETLPAKNEQIREDWKEVERSRESAQVEEKFQPDFDCPSEREIYEERLQELQDKGGMSQEEMERSAYKHAKESIKNEGTAF